MPCLFWSDGEHLLEPALVTLRDDGGRSFGYSFVRKVCRCAQVDVRSRAELEGRTTMGRTTMDIADEISSETFTFVRFT